MPTADRLAAIGALAVACVLAASACSAAPPDRSVTPPPGPGSALSAMEPDRRDAPMLDGRSLPLLDPARRPADPVAWAAGPGPVRSSTWWTPILTRPDDATLWADPLVVRVLDGRLEFGLAPHRPGDGSGHGSTFSSLARFDVADAPSVVGHGAFHVRLAVDGHRVTVTQASATVDLELGEALPLRIPGSAADTRSREGGRAVVARLRTPIAATVVVSAVAPVAVDGDVITLPPGHVAVSLLPPTADDALVAAAVALAGHPVRDTTESLTWDAAEGATQRLVADRGGVASIWALRPWNDAHWVTVDPSPGPASLPSPTGPAPLVVADAVVRRFAAVPVRFDAEPAGEAPLGLPPLADQLPPAATGSYSGGTAAFAAAFAAHLADGWGLPAAEIDLARRRSTEALDALVAGGDRPRLEWDPTWGSVVVSPAEFGADHELNDHQLQYGYWVATASLVAEWSTLDDRTRAAVDVLVADYAGAAVVDGSPAVLPDERTWSPVDGHSWASGTVPFDAGNNLESISESTFAWWAAARWFTTTGREEQAEAFLARYTIESHVTGTRWLPEGGDVAGRPWSGVVWSAKSDPTTWFDPAPESALGIRLLPVSPAALGRYADAADRAAARARWVWCAEAGGGCDDRWSNLLATDAAVAGVPGPDGPDPEPATTAIATAWWARLWSA